MKNSLAALLLFDGTFVFLIDRRIFIFPVLPAFPGIFPSFIIRYNIYVILLFKSEKQKNMKARSETRIKQMAAVAVADQESAVNEAQKANEAAQTDLSAAEADLAEKKEALATATAKAGATLHALNLVKARLAALEATQPTDRAQRLQLNRLSQVQNRQRIQRQNRLPSRPKNFLQNQPLRKILKNQLIRKKILTAVTL